MSASLTRSFLFVLCLIGVGISTIGCNKTAQVADPGANAAIAVIDLDKVAKQLGRDVQMSTFVDEHRDSLNQQLAAIKASVEEQILSHQDSVDENLTPEQVQQSLLEMKQNAGRQFNQVQQQAVASLNLHRAKLIQQFRDETRSAAKEVAAREGIKLIVTNNDTVVFSYEKTNDITDRVVERMRHNMAAAEASAVEQVAFAPADSEVQVR